MVWVLIMVVATTSGYVQPHNFGQYASRADCQRVYQAAMQAREAISGSCVQVTKIK